MSCWTARRVEGFTERVRFGFGFSTNLTSCVAAQANFHRAIWYEEIANGLWQSLRQSL